MSFKLSKAIKKSAPTILTILSVIGTIATAYYTGKSTVKAVRIVDKLKEENEEVSNKDIIKATAKIYVKPAIIGTVTIASMLCSNGINKKRQASLASAYMLLDNGYKQYRAKVKELHGGNADHEIKKQIMNDKYKKISKEKKEDQQLFYDMFAERYFLSTEKKVCEAVKEFNKRLAREGYCSLGYFYDLLNCNDELFDSNSFGWSSGQVINGQWKPWMDVYLEPVELEDGMECIILTFEDDPTPFYKD